MNKIVLDHYPVDKLPADLRAGLDPAQPVTIVLTQDLDTSGVTHVGQFSRFRQLSRPHFTSQQEIADHIGRLRGEWDAR